MANGPGDDEMASTRKDRSLHHLGHNFEQFEESLEVIRDLAVHIHGLAIPSISPKTAFRNTIRMWHAADSDDAIDQLFMAISVAFAKMLDELIGIGKWYDKPIPKRDVFDAAKKIIEQEIQNARLTDPEPWVFIDAWDKVMRRRSRKETLRSSLLVSTVGAFEVLVGGVIRSHMEAFPGAMGSDKVYSYADVAKHVSIEAFEQACISDRVETIIRSDVEKWFQWTEKQLRVAFIDATAHKDDIVDAILRRNLIVHNASAVNEIYLSKAPTRHLPPDGISKVTVDQDYLLSIMDKFHACGTTLTVRAMCAIDARNKHFSNWADAIASNTVYRLLVSQRYNTVIDIARSLEGIVISGSTSATMQVNRWLAQKSIGGLESIADEVSRWDVSALEMRFKMAKHALLDEVDQARAIANLLRSSGQLRESEWRSWPLLTTVREIESMAQESSNGSREVVDDSDMP